MTTREEIMEMLEVGGISLYNIGVKYLNRNNNSPLSGEQLEVLEDITVKFGSRVYYDYLEPLEWEVYQNNIRDSKLH